MIRNLIGAALGRRLAGSQNGTRGALLGMAAPWIVRRAFTPLGLAVGAAYGAKKLYDRRQRSRSSASPSSQI
jgi:hypothetical protein